MKNLTIVISIFGNKKFIRETIEKIPIKTNFDILIINDNPKVEYDYKGNHIFINNKKNVGKFWSIINNLNYYNKYFLTIDPDDILNDGINWKEIKKIEKKNFKGDYIINSFFLKRKNKKSKLKKSKKIMVFFNPNIIFKTENILKSNNFFKILFNGKLTYFDDVILLLMSSINNNIEKINIPFYTYTPLIGITSNWKENADEIIRANEIVNKIKNKYNWRIKFFRINRVKILYKKAKKIYEKN